MVQKVSRILKKKQKNNCIHPIGDNCRATVLCSLFKWPLYKLVKGFLSLKVDVNASLCPLGGAGHGTVSLQELQDRL